MVNETQKGSMRAQIRILPGKGKEELQVGLKVLGLKIIVFFQL